MEKKLLLKKLLDVYISLKKLMNKFKYYEIYNRLIYIKFLICHCLIQIVPFLPSDSILLAINYSELKFLAVLIFFVPTYS
jgi:hypothetical protein